MRPHDKSYINEANNYLTATKEGENNMRRTVFVRRLSLIVIMATVSVLIPAVPVSAQYPREKTLYYYIDGGPLACPGVFNPYNVMCWSHVANQYVMEHLFYLPYYSGEIVPGFEYTSGELIPWLAESYEQSEDFTEVTIHLREGVTWNDGEPFTAEDVAFTYNMLKENAPDIGYSGMVADWISEVQVIDDHTVWFKLTKPNPRIMRIDLFTPTIWGAVAPLPKHIWEGEDPVTFENNPPVFTGPYKLVEYSDIGDYLVWERRDDWWGTEAFGFRPAPDYVICKAFTSEERVIMDGSRHEQDILGYMTVGGFLKLRETNPYVTSWYDQPPYAWGEVCPGYMPVNCPKYPWNLKEVRWALSYAIDREAISEVALENTALPINSLFPPFMLPQFNELASEKGVKYHADEYNPDKAIEIFEGLDFTRGADGVWVTPNGTRLEMTALINSGWLYIKKWGLQVVDQLRDVGIDAVAKLLEGPPFGDALDTGAWDTAPAFWICGSVDEPYATLNQFHSKWVSPMGELPLGGGGFHRWVNATYDALVDQIAEMSPEDPEYLGLVDQALEIWYQELPAIPLNSQPALIVVDSYYWQNWASDMNPYMQPYYQCASFRFILFQLKPSEIDYSIAYFTKDTSNFRGVDLIWYGPFEAGDAARIPTGDIEFWNRKGYASYTPVITPTGDIEALAAKIDDLSTAVSDLSSGLEGIETNLAAVSGTITTLTTAVAIEAIVIILVVVLAFVLARRQAED